MPAPPPEEEEYQEFSFVEETYDRTEWKRTSVNSALVRRDPPPRMTEDEFEADFFTPKKTARLDSPSRSVLQRMEEDAWDDFTDPKKSGWDSLM